MAADKKTAHPPWAVPDAKGAAADVLLVSNSLTSTKVPFVTIAPKQVKAYICGPTVYDSAHLGHARAYITFDIIRRILADYFGYHVFWTMNITDIDDKIILRARRDFLIKKYAEQTKDLATIVSDVRAAFAAANDKHKEKLAELDGQLKKAPKSLVEALQKEIEQETKKQQNTAEDEKAFEAAAKAAASADAQTDAQSDAKAAAAAGSAAAGAAGAGPNKKDGTPDMRFKTNKSVAATLEAVLKPGRSVLATALDKRDGSGVKDHAIFQAHARRYEKEFMEDMQNLGVRDPDALTRVSEYVPHIIEFIKRIEKAGIAYAAGGSVYFSVSAFKQKGHAYAKLAPWQVGNEAAAAEGEGELAAGTAEKKSNDDFALWKKSKPGEPAWPSPWGEGRPGWHIECSAMASDLLGKQFDIHAGGEDLKFPHHDNELAQSEASLGCHQWVNYFLHAGHLNIKGLKMSKSLKNFITIRDVLREYSARHIRLLFLLQPWDDKMNYSDGSLEEAAAKEKAFKEFFMNAAANIRARGGTVGVQPGGSQKVVEQVWSPADHRFHNALVDVQGAVHKALLDNFNYPKAMESLLSLVTETNKYTEAKESRASYKPLLIQKAAQYVHKILKVFGVLGEESPTFESGAFSTIGGAEALAKAVASGDAKSAAGAGGGDDKKYTALLDVWARFRDAVRGAAQKKAAHTEFLKLTDELRDTILPALGIRLEDKSDGPSVWKLDNAADLMKQMDEKKAAAKANALKKLKNQLADRQKDIAKYRDASKDGKTWFAAANAAAFTRFDAATGVPTHDKDGKEVSKSAAKAAQKAIQKQDSVNKEFNEKLAKDPEFHNKLIAAAAELEAEIAKVEAQ